MIEEHFVTSPSGTKCWPLAVTLKSAERALCIAFDDGRSFTLPAALLRRESPSAEVQGHGKGQKRNVTGKDYVGITALEPVGNYALRISFDDGHDTGIYSWDYLYRLGMNLENLCADFCIDTV